MGGRIQLKFGIKGVPPEGIRTEKFVCFCSGSVQLHKNGIFFYFCKMHTWLLCAPGILDCTTHDTLECVLIGLVLRDC